MLDQVRGRKRRGHFIQFSLIFECLNWFPAIEACLVLQPFKEVLDTVWHVSLGKYGHGAIVSKNCEKSFLIFLCTSQIDMSQELLF